MKTFIIIFEHDNGAWIENKIGFVTAENEEKAKELLRVEVNKGYDCCIHKFLNIHELGEKPEVYIYRV